MLDPSRALQDAVIAALKADTDVAAMIGTRIYDAAPKNAFYPYVTMGGTQVLPDKADCIDGTETSLTIDAWSRPSDGVGFGEVMNVAKVVAAALDDAEITVSDQHLVDLVHESTRTLRDPDGVTRHAIITFRALTEPA